jgi:hypothetical protein
MGGLDADPELFDIGFTPRTKSLGLTRRLTSPVLTVVRVATFRRHRARRCLCTIFRCRLVVAFAR